MVQPFGSTKQTKNIEPTVSVLFVEKGPLGVKAISSCKTDVTPTFATSYSPKMEIHISYGPGGKEVEKIGEVGGDDILSDERWRSVLESALSGAEKQLTARGVFITSETLEPVRAGIQEARRESLRLVVRAIARSLIHALPASDACQVWMEEEARRIFES